MTTRPSFAERLVIVTRARLGTWAKKQPSSLHKEKNQKKFEFFSYVGKGYARFRWLTQALLAACRRTAWAKGPLRAAVLSPARLFPPEWY